MDIAPTWSYVPGGIGFLLPPDCLAYVAFLGATWALGPFAAASRDSLVACLSHAREELASEAFCGRCQWIYAISVGSHCPECRRRLRSILRWDTWSLRLQLRFVFEAADLLVDYDIR